MCKLIFTLSAKYLDNIPEVLEEISNHGIEFDPINDVLNNLGIVFGIGDPDKIEEYRQIEGILHVEKDGIRKAT